MRPTAAVAVTRLNSSGLLPRPFPPRVGGPSCWMRGETLVLGAPRRCADAAGRRASPPLSWNGTARDSPSSAERTAGWSNATWLTEQFAIRVSVAEGTAGLLREAELTRFLPQKIGYPETVEVGVWAGMSTSSPAGSPGRAWPRRGPDWDGASVRTRFGGCGPWPSASIKSMIQTSQSWSRQRRRSTRPR